MREVMYKYAVDPNLDKELEDEKEANEVPYEAQFASSVQDNAIVKAKPGKAL